MRKLFRRKSKHKKKQMDSNLNRVLNQNRHQLSGQLSKYTNVVKGKVYKFCPIDVIDGSFVLLELLGWQYRWFTVDAAAGTLSYYLCESGTDEGNPHIIGNSPRGQVMKSNEILLE